MVHEPGLKPSPSPMPKAPATALTMKTRIIRTFATMSLAFALAVLFNTYTVKRDQLDEATRSIKSSALKLPSISLSRINSTLLTDSIVSIVQSYYVDSDRVDQGDLWNDALSSLKSSLPGFVVKEVSGVTTIEYAGEVQKWDVIRDLSYDQLVDRFGLLAELLDRGLAQTPHKANEGVVDSDSRNGTAFLLNAMLSALDAHSTLMSPESYRELRQGTEGAFGGLGVLVGIRDSVLTVIKPLPQSPALRAGIKSRDKILSINGTETFGVSLDQLVDAMRGEPGTNVQVHLLRSGADSPEDLALKREVIHVDSVTAKEHRDNGLSVLHLNLESFASRTSREVLSAIKKARKKNGGSLDGLILDLRSNPGGLLDQAVQVADLFLKSGVIVSTRGRREEIEQAGKGYDEVDFPIAILVNGDSASASEIVAGALQDHERAVVIGQPSFGKGSVQTIFELPEDRALKLTIARYYTPANRSIQNIGIIPDIWVQPVLKSAKNENLLGPYRYKNERFLRNHLTADESQPEIKDILKPPAFKGYYLAERDVESSNDGDTRNDRETEVALAMLHRLKTAYPSGIPEASRRSSNWLGVAGPEIQKIVSGWDEETISALALAHQVEWRGRENTATDPQVVLKLDEPFSDKPSTKKIVSQGEDVLIPWRIENRNSYDVARISMFVRSQNPSFETKEILVGDLQANSFRKGVIRVNIPFAWEPGALALRVGLAVDAWPLATSAHEVSVTVVEKAVPKIVASISLGDERGGMVKGVLEAREQASVQVEVRNESSFDINKLDVKLFNLAGRQLKFGKSLLTIKGLHAGETAKLAIDVAAGEHLWSERLDIGVAVLGSELGSPTYVKSTLLGLPNSRVGSTSTNLLGH